LEVKNPNVDENFLKGIKLRDYQIEATNKIAEQGFGIIKIATGGGKCVTANTNVTFRVTWAAKQHSVEKVLTIKEFYYNYTYFKRNNSSLRGYKFEVLTDSGFKEVENAFIVKNQSIYEVELEDGKKLVCSSDHRVKTKGGFTHVKDLKVGDNVRVK
jgi:intein/homing endonuclease